MICIRICMYNLLSLLIKFKKFLSNILLRHIYTTVLIICRLSTENGIFCSWNLFTFLLFDRFDFINLLQELLSVHEWLKVLAYQERLLSDVYKLMRFLELIYNMVNALSVFMEKNFFFQEIVILRTKREECKMIAHWSKF